MDRFEHALLAAAVSISQGLDPIVLGLNRINFYVHSQLTFFGVPLTWHDGLIALAWIVVLFMVFRVLQGWLRLVMVVCTLLVLAKTWGYLPPG